MNVISAANWLMDFQNNTLECFSKKIHCDENSYFTLSYDWKYIPETNITINRTSIKDVLIDTGFGCNLILLQSDIQEINQSNTPFEITNSSSDGLFADSIFEKSYTYSNLNINGHIFDTVQIYSGYRRLIGVKFFRRFDRFFLDTEKKEFKFFYSCPSSHPE